MAFDFFDEATAERYERFEFDFPQDTLAGKAVLLAGGSGGLGAATAALLAKEKARLILSYRSNRERAERLRDVLGADVTIIRANLNDETDRTALLDQAGAIDGLAVFAGDPARGADEATLRASLETNYLGPILTAREAAARMVQRGVGGSIVLLSSMQGAYPFEGSTGYGAAKAALQHAARVLAKEVGGEANVRVNVVSPGATTAGMAQASLRSGKYDRFIRNGVVARFGRAEDVARAVRFLLEPDSYTTGQVLVVDGGMTLRRDQAG